MEFSRRSGVIIIEARVVAATTPGTQPQNRNIQLSNQDADAIFHRQGKEYKKNQQEWAMELRWWQWTLTEQDFPETLIRAMVEWTKIHNHDRVFIHEARIQWIYRTFLSVNLDIA